MRSEIVRLIHAQGVPNHYIYNQKYIPSDEDHLTRGSFLILIDQRNTKSGAFVASLVNTLIREYYRQPGTDHLNDFEQALMRVNVQINQSRLDQEAQGPFELNGAIVLCCDNEIHITHMGYPQALLARDHSLISLIDRNAIGDDATPGFSMITSGEVKPEDVLVLTSPLDLPDQIQPDLKFSLQQIPLYEAGRAYARILRQKLERSVEALFVRFNETQESQNQIFVDKALESMSERLGTYQKHMTRHSAFIWEGVQFLTSKRKQGKVTAPPPDSLASEPQSLSPKPSTKHTPASELPHELPEELDPVSNDDSLENPALEAMFSDDAPSPASDGSYRVKNYWESDTPVAPSEPSIEEPKVYKPAPQAKQQTAQVAEIMRSDVTTREIRSSLTSRLPRFQLKRRTLSILIGALILLLIIVRTVNSLSGKGASPINSSKQSAQERDSLIAQAESNQRDAETAQISDDTSKAITLVMSALDNLKKITEENHNEKSKALLSRSQQSLKTLTKTTELTDPSQSQTINSAPERILATSAGAFISTKDANLVVKYTGDAVSPVKNFPTGKILISSVAYDTGKKAAFLTKDLLVYSVDASSGETKQIERSDNTAWPQSRLLASFDKNIYLIGDSILKGVPVDDTHYKTSPYNPNVATTTVTSIVNNIFFYAIDGDNQMIRIDSKSAKNPISFSGVPAEFIPKKVARIMSNDKDGLVYLFDIDGQRVMEFTTDGVYHRQWVLPKDSAFVDCDVTETSLICASKNKKVATFDLSS